MRFIFLLIIAAVSIITAAVVFGLNKKEVATTPVTQGVEAPKTEAALKTDDVLVAKVNIPLGAKITDAMVDTQPWPHHLVLEGFVLSAGSTDVIGKIARAPLQAHEPFIKNKLANEKDPGFLAASLPPGMRAITIATDAVSGVAGFVFPGDRVDILFANSITEADGSRPATSGGKPSSVEVLVPNLRVLAVNVREANPGAAPAVITPSSVTLEISEEAAQHVRLAEKAGTISLALRSIKDDDSAIPSATHLSDLTKGSAPAAKAVALGGDESVTIIRGGGSKGAITVSQSVDGVSVPANKSNNK